MITKYALRTVRGTTSLAATGLALLVSTGCSKGKPVQGSSGGAVDTATLVISGPTPVAGPGVHVTKTDSKSVRQAGEYKLTDENFAKFVHAADSLQSLQTRDPTARTYLMTDLTDAGAKDADAGLKWLESNPVINNAIASAGLSPRDYFVMSIAIGSAERFMANPDAAPPTPALKDNAEFLRSKTAELEHLKALRDGMTVVKVVP